MTTRLVLVPLALLWQCHLHWQSLARCQPECRSHPRDGQAPSQAQLLVELEDQSQGWALNFKLKFN